MPYFGMRCAWYPEELKKNSQCTVLANLEVPMSLSLRTKLIIAFLGAIFLAIGSVSVVVFMQVTESSRASFRQNSVAQLQRIEAFIQEFLTEGTDNARYLAAMEESRAVQGRLNTFFGSGQRQHKPPFPMGEAEHALFHHFEEMVKTHSNYATVFIGMEDGGFCMCPQDELPGEFDPRARPWYKDTLSSRKGAILSKAYMSTTGNAVSCVTSEVRDGAGKTIGVVGVDINLSTLTDVISRIRLGRTGYVVLMQGDGTLLCEPHHPDLNFQKAEDTGLKALADIAKAKQGSFATSMDGVDKMVSVVTSKGTGWKLAYIIDSSEMMEESRDMVQTILLIGAGLGLLLLGGAWLLSQSFVRPINLLVKSAEAVAGGDFKALPESRFFSGELLTLYESIRKMVDELVSVIDTAEVKSREAEDKSREAEQAMREAEEARAAAERARRDGVLQAAQTLEDVVVQITSTTQEFSVQVEQAAHGATTQRDRTTEAATAMEQMNSSVLEVARNASQAAASADQARQEAESGGTVVSSVIDSIGKVSSTAGVMGESLNTLGRQAEDIGQIMTVITDIADQTNLLALNAAIEAARAGDAGRGFAVVADEVRKLAEKTMTATKEVGQSVSSIQTGAAAAITNMNEASGLISKSIDYAEEAGTALHSIRGIVDSTADQVRAIATASEEQSSVSEQINHNTEEVNRIAEETAETMQQSSVAVNELARLSDTLNTLIGQLKSV